MLSVTSQGKRLSKATNDGKRSCKSFETSRADIVDP
jgi:hypothetical protein